MVAPVRFWFAIILRVPSRFFVARWSMIVYSHGRIIFNSRLFFHLYLILPRDQRATEMSVASKRRFVTKQLESENLLPREDELIAQVIAARGNNLHEVEDANGEKYLVSMPSKFRKSVWIKRGQFVFIQPIEEGDKVRAEITHVLDNENLMYVREQKMWPERFEVEANRLTGRMNADEEKDGFIDADMLPPSYSDEEYDEDEEEEEDGDDEECEDEEEDSEGEDPAVYNPNRTAAPQ
uniref:Probable RNA-binding protein EIF1AD n=1 Tax=Steinernema glaseri TaxID=37863 RepID=A0A1I8AB14_9BILA